MVLYNDLDILQHLVIYPKSQTNNAKIFIHAGYIDYDKYEQWDTDYLMNNIPKIYKFCRRKGFLIYSSWLI